MFTLVKMKDAIPIPANKLDKPRAVAVAHQIEEKFCNRVLLNTGLGICLYELLELGDGLIYQSDASVHVRAEFTLLVFRPFNGEVLVGTVWKSTSQGLWISVGFFRDILVPPQFMPDGSVWDESQELWVWKSEYGDAEISDGPLRFRVTNLIFREVTRPLHAPPAAATTDPHVSAACGVDDGEDAESTPALLIMGSIKDDGLGMVIWWDGQQHGDDEEEGEEA
jgi:DNA-directed RNA polymerase III subunit RPC8